MVFIRVYEHIRQTICDKYPTTSYSTITSKCFYRKVILGYMYYYSTIVSMFPVNNNCKF